MRQNLEFDDIKLQGYGNIILALSNNRSPAYVEKFKSGLIERGYGKIVRKVIEENIHYIYFDKGGNPKNVWNG